MAALFINNGGLVSGTGDVQVSWAGGHQIDDIGILYVQSANEAISLSIPAGFVELTSSPQGVGTAGAAGSVRIAIYWKRATSSSESPATILDPGDHAFGRISIWRGAINTGNPFDVQAGGVDAVSSTGLTIPGLTTTISDGLVLFFAGHAISGSGQQASWPVNPDLTSFNEVEDNSVVDGVGGGISIANGIKAVPGLYSDQSVILAVASAKAYVSATLIPMPSQAQPSLIGSAQSPVVWATRIRP